MAVKHRTGNESETPLAQVCEELRRRILAGEACRAESFFSTFPHLTEDPHQAVELIVAEINARRDHSETVDQRELLSRFPQWYDLLVQRLAAGPVRGIEGEEAGHTDETDLYTGAVAEMEPVPELGRHELIEEIGHGGMGVVWRARDLVLGREVALKMIRAELMDSPANVQRFYREARAVARLHHPNIVPIHGIGLLDGKHCFTMPLLPKRGLGVVKHDYVGRPREAVVLLLKVARAVQAAHEQGVIHRDLKPGNILMDERGEPQVVDFGLAKVVGDRGLDATLPGQRVGTPAYMSPEQARGHTWEMSPASDVWALGIILFELLAGQRPFTAAGSEDVIRQVLEGDLRRPREVCPAVPAKLEAIVQRCLAHQPSRRYPCAGDLADDLDRWLAGQRTRARPRPLWRRAFDGLRRHPVLTAALVLVAVAAALLVAVTGRSSDEALREIHERLARGEAVELIGATGGPRWWRWRHAEGIVGASPLRDNTFTISSVDFALLELLDSPPGDGYRLEAEVQDDITARQDEVGLFFAYRLVTADGKKHHCCCTLGFNDTEPFLAPSSPTPLYHLRPTLWRCIESDGKRSTPLRDQSYDHPDGFRPFRPLAVEVRPEDVRFFWGTGKKPLWVFTWRDIGDWFEAARLPVMPPAIDELPGEPSPCSPRGGLGVFIRNGKASFRNVVVRPIRKVLEPQKEQ
jgi:serine/threonine-protein kinase